MWKSPDPGEEFYQVVALKPGDGDPVRLGLPTDAELDRAIRAFAAAAPTPAITLPATPAARPAPARPPGGAVSAPPMPAAPERRPPDPTAPSLPGTKQGRYRSKLVAAGRCTRCPAAPLPGFRLCARHRRYSRRKFALRTHRKDAERVYGALRAAPELLGPEGSPEFQAGAWLLLIASGLRPKTAAVIAEVEDAERDAMLARLKENGYRRGRKWGFGNWFDAETGTMEFVMTVLTALGVTVRIPGEEAAVPPAAPAPVPLGSHVRKPASACLVCRRVGGACRRHGGPSRSTAFRGAAGVRCSYCRWPARRGHRATCPRFARRARRVVGRT